MDSSAKRRTQTDPVTRYTYRNRVVEVPHDHLAIGLIVAPHSNKGEVRVELHTDFPERFRPGLVVYMGTELEPLTVVTARPHKGQLLIHFDGVYNRDEAEALRNRWIFVHEDDAVELDEDTYFVHQLIGLQVVTTDGARLGQISDVLFTGANEVYVVQPASGVNKDKEILLPAIAQVVQDVNLPDGTLTIELLDGLVN